MAPRPRTRRLPCSITARTYTLAPLSRLAVKKSQRQDPLRLGPQELRPPRAVPARGRDDPGVPEDPPHRRRRHRDVERRKLAVDAAVAPRLILTGQPQHHRQHLAIRCRASEAAAARQPQPAAADDIAMPAQDRGRSNNQPHRCQPVGWQGPGEQGQPRPVRPRQTRMNARRSRWATAS